MKSSASLTSPEVLEDIFEKYWSNAITALTSFLYEKSNTLAKIDKSNAAAFAKAI